MHIIGNNEQSGEKFTDMIMLLTTLKLKHFQSTFMMEAKIMFSPAIYQIIHA